MDPLDPSNPIDPMDPSVPSDPIDPMDPSVPSDPIDHMGSGPDEGVCANYVGPSFES